MNRIYKVSLQQSVVPYMKRKWYEILLGYHTDVIFDRTPFFDVTYKYFYCENENAAQDKFKYIYDMWYNKNLLHLDKIYDGRKNIFAKGLKSKVKVELCEIDFANKHLMMDIQRYMPIAQYYNLIKEKKIK